MTRITIDAELRERLGGLREPVELCDESGRVVGRVVLAEDPNDYDLSEPKFDEEELRRRQEFPRRYTTDEVVPHLESL